jgi:hypothetical protein
MFKVCMYRAVVMILSQFISDNSRLDYIIIYVALIDISPTLFDLQYHT